MRKNDAALVGVAAVACVACCAAPILGVLAAVGLGTVAGVALWGVGALVVGLLVLGVLVRRRRVSAVGCAAPANASGDLGTVAVAPPSLRPRP
jgi:hypothetical protein